MMNAISYKQCIQDFKISHMDFSQTKNKLTLFVFLSKFTSFLELCLFKKSQNEILTAFYLKKYLSKGIETLSADRR